MTDTPRTFTLAWVAKNGRRTWRVVDARFGGQEDERVKVIEKAPVLAELRAAQKRATDARQDHKEALAERGRMLDLLEAVKREIECPEDAVRVGIPVYAEIRQCLREHGRLPKEEQ